MSELALARSEITRYLRRRSNARDIVIAAGFLFMILAVVGGVGAWAIQAIMSDVPEFAAEAEATLGALERTRYILLTIEAFGLIFMAHILANRAITEEIDSASLPLLLQTPISLDQVVLGKAIGISIVLLVLHGIYLTVLMVPTPFMRRSPWAVLVELVVIWLIAVCFVPDGAAEGLTRLNGGRKRLAPRLVSLGRWGALLIILQALIPLEIRKRGVNAWDVLIDYWKMIFWLEPTEYAGAPTIDPVLLTVLVVGWLLLTSLIMWFLLIRGRTS